MDLYNAAIGGVLKYSLATLRTTETADRELEQFASKCLRGVEIPKWKHQMKRGCEAETEPQMLNLGESAVYLQYTHSYKKESLAIYTDGKQL